MTINLVTDCIIATYNLLNIITCGSKTTQGERKQLKYTIHSSTIYVPISDIINYLRVMLILPKLGNITQHLSKYLYVFSLKY